MNKFNVAIIGAGRIGATYDNPFSENILSHAHAFKNNGQFTLVGLVDSNSDSLEKASRIWNIPAYESVEELFSDCGRIDVVVNAVPDNLHYKILEKLTLYNIKVIITEKPITLSLSEALKLNNMYKDTGKKIILNYSRRFIKEYQNIKTIIESNELGRFVTGTGYYGKGLLHNGSHMIDILNFLIGNYKKVTQVNKIPDYNSNDETKTLMINYDDNTLFNLIGIDSSLFTIFEMDLIFERGRIKFLESGFNIEIYKVKGNIIYEDYNVQTLDSAIKVSFSAPMLGLIENVIEVLDGKEPLCKIDDGINVLRLWENMKD